MLGILLSIMMVFGVPVLFWAENIDYSRSGRLTDGLCIFIAELFVISQAVAYIARQVQGCFAIFSDCLRAVLLLKRAWLWC